MFHFNKEKYLLTLFKKACVFFLLCCSLENYSQVFYSIDPNYLKSKREQNNLISSYKYNYPDTSITEFSNYAPRNFMGNIGMPNPNYLFQYGTDNLGFRFFNPPTSTDKYREDQVEYYRSKGPYANLTGIAGIKQLQIFRMLFTHTYRDKVNITLKFSRYTSLGYYIKQQTYTNNFFLTSNYSDKKNRFGYYLYVLNNGNKNQENGGIADGTLTDSTALLKKDLFLVRISNANRDNRELKLMINPWFKINTRNDSLRKIDHYIQLKSKFSNNSYRYKDIGAKSDTFYKKYYYDTLSIDSSHVRQFVNDINYSLLTVTDKFGFSAGYRNELSQIWQKTDTVFLNHISYTDLVYRTNRMVGDSLHRKKQNFETRFNAQYILAGVNSGNYKAEINSVFEFNEQRKRNVFLNALSESRNPDFIYNNWRSNHFYWHNNGFKPQQQTQLKVGLNLGRNFSISVFNQIISNFLYFDSLALPRQYSKTINNLGFTFNFTKIFFKHLGISLNHVYQSTSKKEYVRVPGNITTAKLFYHGYLFKNNLQLQIGSQVQIYESFYGYNYMPSTEVFYLQNRSQTGTYPYLDIYLNARIHPVSIFLKIENALQGSAGSNYSFVPGYYQTDRTYRFGISWMFFD